MENLQRQTSKTEPLCQFLQNTKQTRSISSSAQYVTILQK
jgi:hypothetical protein